MKRALLSLLAIGLGGCATVPDPRFDYACRGTANLGLNQAMSVRWLNSQGRILSGMTEWKREDASDILDLQARWQVEDGAPVLANATVQFRFHLTAFTTELGQLSLSTEAATFKAGWSTGTVRHLTLTGGQVQMLFRDGETIWVALFNRSVQLMGATGIEAIAFTQGIELARQADSMSRVASADYLRRCQRHDRIVQA